MVSFTISEGKVEKMAIVGDLRTTSSEVLCMLYVIYKAISRSREEAGEMFKEYIESAIKDGIVFCDEDEREKIIEKKAKEKNKEVTAEIEQLLREIRRKK